MADEPIFFAATSSDPGSAGLVKAPKAGDNSKFLRGDATWSYAVTDIKQDGVNIVTDNTAEVVSPIGYYTCSTATSTAAKVGDYVSGAKYSSTYLPAGAMAMVKFTNANTATANPTLNLNGSGAKSMMQYGTTPMGTTNYTTG